MSANGNGNSLTAPISGPVPVLSEQEIRDLGLEEAPTGLGPSDEEMEDGDQSDLYEGGAGHK